MRPEQVLFAWPPTACTQNVGHFVKFAKNVEHVMTGYRRVSVVRVFLRLNRNQQLSALQEGDRPVMAWVVRDNIHVAVASALSILENNSLSGRVAHHSRYGKAPGSVEVHVAADSDKLFSDLRKDVRHSGTPSTTFGIHQKAGPTNCRSAADQTSIHAKYAQNYRAVLARLARVAR